MKIVAVLIIGYFALGFIGTGLMIEAVRKKPKAIAAVPKMEVERPPLQIPLTLVLVLIFLSLPVIGYRKARKQQTFLHLGPKFWLWGPVSLFVVGAIAALALHLAQPTFFQ